MQISLYHFRLPLTTKRRSIAANTQACEEFPGRRAAVCSRNQSAVKNMKMFGVFTPIVINMWYNYCSTDWLPAPPGRGEPPDK